MKTPEEWIEYLKDHPDSKRPTLELLSWEFLNTLIKEIQNDAMKSMVEKASNNTELEPGQKWQSKESGNIYTVIAIKHFYVSLSKDGTNKSKSCVIPYFVKTHTQVLQ
jgi:alpha-L-fucosidase